MTQDFRYGLRMLAKHPSFSAIAIITLALGIGANTIVFSGVYALFLEKLPYPNADRLFVLSRSDKQGVESGISYPDFADWKQQNTAFEQMAASMTIHSNLTAGDMAERVTGSYVSEELFPLLGGRALLGRTFLPEDFRLGGKVIILSHGYWQRRFGANADLIGKPIQLDRQEFTVVGVMPPAFQYPFRASFWTPLSATDNARLLQDRSANSFEVVAALRPGVTAARAAGEMSVLAQRADAAYAVDRQERAVQVTGLRDTLPGIARYRTPTLVLQFAVLFVLLIACVNLANLLLARTAERRQEFTIRLALGASRTRLVRQLLSESLLLGSLGCLSGLLLAWWGVSALRASIPWRIPGVAEVEINGPTLLVTLLVSLLTSLAFGIVPALMATRQDLNESLKSGARHAGPDPRRRLSGVLVSAEVALAVVLLVASGLMLRTFLNLTKEDPGFKPEQAVAISLSVSPSQYPNYESLVTYFNATIRSIKAVPGVGPVGGVTYMPLVGYNPGTAFIIAGREAPSPETMPRADFQPVTPEYFDAMGIPLLRGRQFHGADLGGVPEEVIINQALARKFWPGEDPLGKQIVLQGNPAANAPLTVIGVVGDVKQFGLHTDSRPELYVPMARYAMTLIARTDTPPESVIANLREVVEKLGADQAAYTIRPLEQAVIESIEKRRIFAFLLGTLALVALVMAAMGIYGVISYLVVQRTREIGIRMALGAQSRDILRSVIAQGLWFAVTGIGVGVVASLGLTRALTSLLFGVSAADPAVFTGIALLIVLVTFMASCIPARRATKIDPLAAIRYE